MPESTKLIHEILPVGMLQCNSHIVGDPETREAIVIDPGDDAARILQVIEGHHLKVTAIVVKNTHIDHVVAFHRQHETSGSPESLCSNGLAFLHMPDSQAT